MGFPPQLIFTFAIYMHRSRVIIVFFVSISALVVLNYGDLLCRKSAAVKRNHSEKHDVQNGKSKLDAIDWLVSDISSNDCWSNGSQTEVNLSASATIAEIVAKVIATYGDDNGGTWKPKVLGFRQFYLKQNLSQAYVAVWFKQYNGEELVLVWYEKGLSSWVARGYIPYHNYNGQ